MDDVIPCSNCRFPMHETEVECPQCGINRYDDDEDDEGASRFIIETDQGYVCSVRRKTTPNIHEAKVFATAAAAKTNYFMTRRFFNGRVIPVTVIIEKA